jgi:hypothetical protein
VNHFTVRLAFETRFLSSCVSALSKMLINESVVKPQWFDFLTVGIMISANFLSNLA